MTRPRLSKAWFAGAAYVVSVLTTACLGDAAGPRGTVIIRAQGAFTSDSLLVGAPGEALPTPVAFVATDQDGRPIGGASVTWAVSNRSGTLDGAVTRTNEAGGLSATWILGPSAADTQTLSVAVSTGRRQGEVTLRAIAKPYIVTRLVGLPDTLTVRLGSPASLKVEAVDPFGNQFAPVAPVLRTTDARIAVVDSAGLLHPIRRGTTNLIAQAGGVADTDVVRAIQIVQTIRVAHDSMVFTALGQTRSDSVSLIDDLGLPVLDSAPAIAVEDTTIVRTIAAPALVLQSVTNGSSLVHLTVGSVTRDVIAFSRQLPMSVTLGTHAIGFNALTDTARASLQVVDSLGVPITNPLVQFRVADTSVALVDATGLVRSRNNGTTSMMAAVGGVADTSTIQVAQVITSLVPMSDTVNLHAISAVAPLSVTAYDRLGAVVVGAIAKFSSADSTVAAITGTQVRAVTNGHTVVTAQAGASSTPITVNIMQVASRVLVAPDTIRFPGLHETQVISGIAVDSLGFPLKAGVAGVTVSDSSVAQLFDSVTVRSVKNGITSVHFTVAGLEAVQVVRVQQVPASLTASLNYAQPIVTMATGDSVPLQCAAFDRDGFAIPGPVAAQSAHGTMAGSSCSSLRIAHSGYDTINVNAGSSLVTIPAVVAVKPIVNPAPHGQFMIIDSLPSGTTPWAVSARRNSQGKFEVYFAAYSVVPDSSGELRADLHRLVSSDGLNFQYDGMVLQHDTNSHGLNGTGVEHVFVVPRSDGPGWRMYYASGSLNCYGWQVFSATSTDERNWTKEPGVRITNGGHLPPQTCMTPPWPAGEGMVVDQLPSGQWRMVVSTYEHVLPSPGRFQITEWRSNDQLNWTYLGPILTTRQMPVYGNQDVYGPNIREFSPGLYRMVFTADNRGVPGARRRLWSAVSTDRETWQVEGFLIGEPDSIAVGAYLYGALVDDHVFFLRADNSILQFATATVTMP